MTFSAAKRLTTAWIVVVVLTLIYLAIDGAADDGALEGSTVASVAAVALALAKLRIIMREFMDVRHAPRMLRLMTDALVIVMGACLLGTYLMGRALA